MSELRGTLYSFTIRNEEGASEPWSVYYDIESERFVAEWIDRSSSPRYGHDSGADAATADELQASVNGLIPEDILARLKDSTVNGRQLVTLISNDEGVRIFGAPRDEATREQLATSGWRWSDGDRSWSSPPSQEEGATTMLVDITVRRLRGAGHDVSVLAEDTGVSTVSARDTAAKGRDDVVLSGASSYAVRTQTSSSRGLLRRALDLGLGGAEVAQSDMGHVSGGGHRGPSHSV